MVQTWDPAHKNAAITLTGGNLIGTDAGGGYHPCFALNGVTTGKYYWEVTVNVAQSSPSVGIGNVSTSSTTGAWLGVTTDAIGWFVDGGVWNNNAQVATWEAPGTGSLKRVCLALDLTNNKLWGRVGAAGNWNNAAIGSQNPATNTGGVTVGAGVLAAAVVPGFNTFTSGDVATGAFDQASWAGTAPGGFSPFDAPLAAGVAWRRPVVSLFR